jgi:putative hydrolase of the HAD superfamily
VAEKIQDEFEHYAPQDVVFADTPLVLKALQQAGYVLGLVSNRSHELDTLATQYGFRQYLNFTLSGGQAHSYKPDAAIFQMALQMAGNVLPSQAVYIGDNYYADVLGAMNVGIDAILVDPHDLFGAEYSRRVRMLKEVLAHIEPALSYA